MSTDVPRSNAAMDVNARREATAVPESTTDTRADVIVIGGGIGGLAAATALTGAGLTVRLYERQQEFGEVGAGMQLASNCTRILDDLGLLDEAKRLGVLPTRMVMRDALDARHGSNSVRDRLPVRQPLGRARHGGVRRERNQAVAQFALEPVHDRNDGNQRRDAETHPGHRDPGDERDEKALPAGADVTQANEDGQRVEHREKRLAWDGRPQGYPAQPGFARFPPGQIVNWNKVLGCDALAPARRML